MSVYNYHLIEEIINFLIPQWPNVVTFGKPNRARLYLNEISIPPENRQEIIDSLERAVGQILSADIELGQQHNAVNAVRSVIANLSEDNFDLEQFNKLKKFVNKLDQVKRINIASSKNPVNFS